MLTEGLFAVTDCGPTQFCGPTAIAALTGLPIVKVEDAVLAYRSHAGTPRRVRNGRARVKTMWGTEIEPVLRKLGYRATLIFSPCYVADKRTFASLMRELSRNGHKNAPLLVLYTGHFVAVRGPLLVDTMQNTPVEWSRLLRVQRKRVVRVWRLEAL